MKRLGVLASHFYFFKKMQCFDLMSLFDSIGVVCISHNNSRSFLNIFSVIEVGADLVVAPICSRCETKKYLIDCYIRL